MTNLEARLRAALSARALSVTADDLQPAVPPTATTVRPPRRLAWPWIGLLAGGATLALIAGVVAVRTPGEDGTAPAPNPPAATVPSQPASPAPSQPPSPSPSQPGTPLPSRSTEVSPEPALGSDGLPKGMPETSKGSARPRPPVRVSPGLRTEPSSAPSPPPSFG
ncbi:hypothetical protein [Actinoplanes sp. NPDC049316]|uniref:hypothetical protein n=1 Tax=Actinoplanes sp. NPDC049316 TaxID=3154727 RepID=UPI003418EAD9